MADDNWKNEHCGTCRFRVGVACRHSPPQASKDGVQFAGYPIVLVDSDAVRACSFHEKREEK